METFIVERISDQLLILEREDTTKLIIPIKEMTIDYKLGDVLKLDNGVFSVDSAETDSRRVRIQQKTLNLFRNKT